MAKFAGKGHSGSKGEKKPSTVKRAGSSGSVKKSKHKSIKSKPGKSGGKGKTPKQKGPGKDKATKATDGGTKKKGSAAPSDESKKDKPKQSLKDPSLTRKEKKVLLKQVKDKSGIVEQLMKHYEKLRRKDVPTSKKGEMIDAVFEITDGQEKEVIFKHSAVRVFEMCVKYGNAKQKEKVFELFQQYSTELIQSKYAKFLVKKLMKYGNAKQRSIVIKSLHGKVGKLIRQKEAGSVLEYVYNEYANASQRASLIEEFFGPEYAVFKASIGRSLDEIFAAEPDKKPLLLKHMKNCLVPLVQKEVVSHSLLHRALFEFFSHADGHLRSEMIEALLESVAHILHSREGSRVAMHCIWFGKAKERKVIMKTFKTFVLKICKEEFGHLVLLSLFDSIDDTVLLKKIVFPEMIANLSEIAFDQYGRKVLLYIFAHRSRSFSMPEVIQLLSTGDGNQASKKNADVRIKELQDGILPQFCAMAATECEKMLSDKSASQVLLSATTCINDADECMALFEAVAKLAAKPFEEENQSHAIGHPCCHWVIRRLIQQDKQRQERGCTTFFSRVLVDAVGSGDFADWAQINRGCFVLVSLLETGFQDVVDRVKEDLAFAGRTLKDKNSKGAELLAKLLLQETN